MTHVNSFILSTLENGIQKVVLNKPAKKNAFSFQMYKELKMLLNESAKNNEVLIFVLTANGDFFSSGNDISASMESPLDLTFETVKELIDTIIMYPKLLIAIVNGPAIGIAATILGIFDIVYASDKAYFQTPFSSLGLIAEGCSSYTFPRLLGHSKAGDMLYLGYKMNAQEAKQRGLYIAYLQLYISDFIPRKFIFVHRYTGYLKITKKAKFFWSQYQQSVTAAAFSTSRSSGGSNCTIQSTSGISRPLAATSVQKNSTEKDLITYMNTHYWQIDIIQEFMMIFNGHAGTKENHYFLLFRHKLQFVIAGIKNAKVLPDPVLAAPTKSLPSKREGIAFACISVIFVKPISFIAFNVFSHTFSFNTEKLVSFVTSKPTAVPGTKQNIYQYY
ncbi:Peroxisomal 3,2-trans-enoyl-CoA isomerase [Trachymyrmex zeteki]|uniref:Peroxisomal 3,2-trans-enoyl-CoA isomerase n=1 Tax=Mycetomoellerius zeteki TaxID=64791 RepID=A0A151XCV7_9HYME|nr:Peroxisomal 3,2-trans-enoyl-CoA isomerase [Trachymyrmex zeteki]